MTALFGIIREYVCNAPGRMIIRPYWNAFSLRPSPEMARRDM